MCFFIFVLLWFPPFFGYGVSPSPFSLPLAKNSICMRVQVPCLVFVSFRFVFCIFRLRVVWASFLTLSLFHRGWSMDVSCLSRMSAFRALLLFFLLVSIYCIISANVHLVGICVFVYYFKLYRADGHGFWGLGHGSMVSPGHVCRLLWFKVLFFSFLAVGIGLVDNVHVGLFVCVSFCWFSIVRRSLFLTGCTLCWLFWQMSGRISWGLIVLADVRPHFLGIQRAVFSYVWTSTVLCV